MKKGIVCLLAITFTCFSYGQNVEVKKELTALEKIETLSEEFQLSPEQTSFLKNYLTLEQTLKAKNATKEEISAHQLKMEGTLVKLFPLELVAEIRSLNKKDPKKLTKKEIGM